MKPTTVHASFLAPMSLTAAGSVQADATAIPLSHAFFVATGNSVKGLRLPSASKGTTIYVVNLGSGGFGTLKLWPASGDAINALGANVALVMASLSSVMITALTSSQWHTVPTVPS